jgi:hypothetical protein
MEVGTVALVRLLDSLTTIPPVGAADDKVTVPVVEVSPVTATGLILTETNVGGVIVSVAVCATAPRVAVTDADV